tara:strand:- start:5342 stop:6112 length:771 start_codon:yes stop_codon:yes gene_type:complete
MPALPTTGEIRFSAIGTEFSDPYSLTDSTKTIRLSHYYTNIPDIKTTHLAVDYNPPTPDPPFPTQLPNNDYPLFKLSFFRGKERFIEQTDDEEEPTGPPPPEQSFDIYGNRITMQGSSGLTGWEYTKGLEITNLTGRDRNHPNNYFNRRIDTQSYPVRYLPQYIIQAQAGDILQINSEQKTAGNAHVSIWIWINGWRPSILYKETSATYYSFPQYQIPVNTPPGKYAIGFSVSWANRTVEDPYYRSWRQYSLQVWE